ncbi:MAG TPA: hypothetical protein VL832_14610 [Puia sp.]|jgi:hypothetical protein|nr:hypothetical protein [Puia sp.]
MKFILFLTLLFIFIATGSSCKKTAPPSASATRKIQFNLYTQKDFSGITDDINFTLLIKEGPHILWDSALATMKIKDIPDSLHKLTFEKQVTASNDSTLVVGFLYEIVNVGNSWFLDTCQASDKFKVVNYPFQ